MRSLAAIPLKIPCADAWGVMAVAGAPPTLSQMGVATVPGMMVEKRIFSSQSSLRNEVVKAISADFVALYMVWKGIGENTIPEAVLAI